MSLKNNVAIVTGASRGIGKAIALKLAKEGADVIVTATTLETAQKTAKEIEAIGRKALPLAVNVADFSNVEALVASAFETFAKVDILVNNAGITKDNLLIRMTQEQWDDVLSVNLKGTFNCIRAMTKKLMKQRSGKIINITSVVGIMGNAGQANYSASKAGVIGLTKSVARELAPRNIQVNAVAPGFIDTDMTDAIPAEMRENLEATIPLGKIGSTDDIAAAVAFLASADANYITGQVLNVDGGMIM